MIRTTKELGIVTFTVEGLLDLQELLNTIETFYKELVSTLVLWDVSLGELVHITKDDLRRVARFAAGKASHLKTAMVAEGDLNYGLLRMYEVYTKMAHYKPHLQVFRDREPAIEWLLHT